MGKVNSALDGLRPSGSALQNMFASLGEGITDFAGKVWDVVSVTLGVMLRDVIEGIIGAIGDLVGQIINAGNEFQTLKIRLTGLNLNETVDNVKSYSQAMAEANQMTSEQLNWLQTLGAATPFDPAAITNVYTLARSYGFAADEAKRLTKDTIEFAAGMGLGNDVLELVIRNFGQMVQRGKITSTEMRDLARGSFLPLSDILERIAKNMGITVKELSKQITTPTGVPAQEFIKAFEAMVEEEPRFVGAAGRLSRALIPASNNLRELFTSILGLNVVTPIFDVLGEKVASFIDEFVTFNEQGDLIKTDKWDALVEAATGLGTALSGVLSEILGLIPSSGVLSDLLLSGIQSVTTWITDHRADIVGFFKGIGTSIQNDVVPFIRDQLLPAIIGFGQWVWNNKEIIIGFFANVGKVISDTLVPFVRDQLLPAFQQIGDWVTANKPTIDAFFTSLGDIVTQVFENLTGEKLDFTSLDGFLQTLTKFMAWVNKNKDKIAEWATLLIRVFIAVQLLIFVFNIVVGILIFLGGIVLFVVAAFGLADIVVGFVAGALSGLIPIIAGVMIAIILITLLVNSFKMGLEKLPLVVETIKKGFNELVKNATDTWQRIVDSVNKNDWAGVGRAIIDGMVNGVRIQAGTLIKAVVTAVSGAHESAVRHIGAHSPSLLFMELGENTMLGMVKGIENMAGLANRTMENVVARMAVPAMTAPTLIQSIIAQGAGNTTNNADTRNFNLQIHSSAPTEPIIQDFNMLQSLSGA